MRDGALTRAGKWRRPLAWALAVMALDLATKEAARRYLGAEAPLTVIPGFFDLVLTHNTGAAFSILAGGAGVAQGLKMASVAALSLLPFIYFYAKADKGDTVMLTAIGLIWGGALGNIHDRVRWGAVVDFLDFYVSGHHWPAFNAADSAICLGAGLLALSLWLDKPPKAEKR